MNIRLTKFIANLVPNKLNLLLMKKRNNTLTSAISRETMHKILYGLAIKRVGKQKAKKTARQAVGMEA